MKESIDYLIPLESCSNVPSENVMDSTSKVQKIYFKIYCIILFINFLYNNAKYKWLIYTELITFIDFM